MKDLIKKWWFWVIILIMVIIICFTISICALNRDTKENIDSTSMASYEVKEYLEDKGYIFEIADYKNVYNTHYVIIKNDNEGIWIQQYQNEIIGLNMSFKNTSCNNEFADISSESSNNTEAEKRQYEAYMYWLKDMGLRKSQIVEVLNYYDNINK